MLFQPDYAFPGFFLHRGLLASSGLVGMKCAVDQDLSFVVSHFLTDLDLISQLVFFLNLASKGSTQKIVQGFLTGKAKFTLNQGLCPWLFQG